MPQGPIPVQSVVPANTTKNITAAAVIKDLPGSVGKLICVVAGSAGNVTLNDTTTTGGASAANEIITIAFGSLAVGQVIDLNCKCTSGITISAVTTGGQFTLTWT